MWYRHQEETIKLFRNPKQADNAACARNLILDYAVFPNDCLRNRYISCRIRNHDHQLLAGRQTGLLHLGLNGRSIDAWNNLIGYRGADLHILGKVQTNFSAVGGGYVHGPVLDCLFCGYDLRRKARQFFRA